ncbi:MAG: transketolase C-terminal domain-containing protein [Dehalococcoidales bacterium]|nr:transketolase C-terminal domain-containing protein [Dehalococcoidales bacterium]
MADKKIIYRDAINQAYKEEMRRDPNVVIWGEDIQTRVMPGPTFGLFQEFGGERVRNTPLAEIAIVEMTVGAAMAGLRPVGEVMFSTLALIPGDGLFLKVGGWRQRHGSIDPLPIVIRAPQMPGAGVDHSTCIEGFCMHSPGLKVVLPSTPYDAKGLMKSAIRDDDPVVFIDHMGLYTTEGMVPEEEYLVPIGKADVKRQGKDVTIVAWSLMLHTCLAAAEALSKEGISAEVVDPRTLVPLDEETILNSVKKTGRLVVVHEAQVRGGPAGDIIARVADKGFKYLKAPVKRLGALNVPPPRENKAMWMACLPQAANVVAAVKSIM